jgi:hypothetical protein
MINFAHEITVQTISPNKKPKASKLNASPSSPTAIARLSAWRIIRRGTEAQQTLAATRQNKQHKMHAASHSPYVESRNHVEVKRLDQRRDIRRLIEMADPTLPANQEHRPIGAHSHCGLPW